jgi:hypothetical protein
MYNETEATLREQFPSYVKEGEKLENGAQLPFNTVFLLNVNCPELFRGKQKRHLLPLFQVLNRMD